jgi:type II secretory pathway pseudopilin PulG
VKKTSSSQERQLGELAAKGGTSSIIIIIVLLFFFIFFIGIVAAIALPAYQDYTVRARVSEAVLTAGDARVAVVNYYQQYRRIPSTLSEAGFNRSLPPSVRSMQIDPRGGTIIIEMGFNPLTGEKLLLIPSQNSEGDIVWTCTSREIKPKYLPATCR